MWKKLVSATVAVLLLLAILAACGATPEPQIIVDEVVERAPMPTMPAAEKEGRLPSQRPRRRPPAAPAWPRRPSPASSG